jgi:hypothetical protein
MFINKNFNNKKLQKKSIHYKLRHSKKKDEEEVTPKMGKEEA